MHCNKVFSLQICGLVLDCVYGVVGGSDMIGLHSALKCNVGAIWYCVCDGQLSIEDGEESVQFCTNATLALKCIAHWTVGHLVG